VAVCYLLLTLPPLLLVTEMMMPTGCCTRPACPADSRSKCGGSTGTRAEQARARGSTLVYSHKHLPPACKHRGREGPCWCGGAP